MRVQKCASPPRGSPKNPKSNLSFWRLPCPPIAPRTVPLCVPSCLSTAATAALWSAAVLFILSLEGPPLSRLKPRPSTPARKPTSTTLRALCGKSFSSLTSASWRSRRQGYRLSPFRQLCVRLRSQLRTRTPLLPYRPRSSETQNRLHPRLSRPDPRANPAPRPARIHQRLRRQFLARNHPHLA